MRVARAVLLTLLAGLVPAAAATGHAERAAFYPDRDKGSVPEFRTTGTARVVCKRDSAERIRRSFEGDREATVRLRRARLALLERCRYRHIQAAVDDARSGDRILIMPGAYRERPSRRVPVKDARCQGDEYWESSGDRHQEDGRVPTYLHQVHCPNARNLIAIIGDSLDDADRECDQKCNLLVRGMGRKPRSVRIIGDRLKPDVLRADRADGFQLRNLTIEQGAYNNVDVVETNGFLVKNLISRWAHHYGILTFTSDHGLYDDIVAYGSGDSGVYPGSGPEAHCNGYGIEMRDVEAYGNTLGASGTSGNGTWTHDSVFRNNASGIAGDSFAPGHPGMPQDCSKWTGNLIHSNNVNLYDDANEAYCIATPFAHRRKDVVCPVFQTAVGVGFMLYGVNENQFSNNFIFDQHRNGVRLFGLPAVVRGEPSKGYDTSHGNRFTHNTFGVRPDGTRDRNAIDVFWDEQGLRNCWEDNVTAAGTELISDPPALPTCASGGSTHPTGNQSKLAADLPCIAWHPRENPDPVGCDWFTTPPDPDAGKPVEPTPTALLGALTPASVGVRRVEGPGASAQGPLQWSGEARAVRPAALPDDRLVTGRVRNVSASAMHLDAQGARLLDDAGREVRGTVTFARGFAHGLYGPAVGPREAMPEFLARRLGFRALVDAGASVPFTVAWRLPGGKGSAPTRVDFGNVTVALPPSG